MCTECYKEFTRWDRLDAHMKSVHTIEGPKNICNEPGCGKTYTSKQTLVLHQKKIHSDEPLIKNEDGYMCEECGKSFSSGASLKKHSFLHSGIRPFQCARCPKKYTTKHKLKEHMNRHEGIKNYICPHCGMKKTTSNELRVHINYHTRETEYPCSACPQIFFSPGNRGRHFRIVHCGIKAYSCTHCDRSFGKAETLKHHVMTHTGQKPHQCNVCSRRFIQLVALQSHIKTHNKPK